MINIDDKKYELVENYRDSFDIDEFKSYFTDYFRLFGNLVLFDWMLYSNIGQCIPID